jgi:uncharacterized protein UPF0236
MPTSRDKTHDAVDPEEHIRRLVQEFEKRLRQQIPARPEALPQTLDEIEQVADRLGQEIKEKIQKELLEMAGNGFVGKVALCSCRRMARFVSTYQKQVLTRCGAATLWRAYYHCGACNKGFCPLDAQLELGPGQCSAGVRALLSRFACFLPYRRAAQEMESICGIAVSASTLRREAQAVGRALEQDWSEKQQQVRANRAKVPPHRPSSLHLSMDGVLIHVGGEWREVKCAVAYETGKDEQGHAQGVKRASYYATLARSGSFGPRVQTLAFLAGSGRCSRIGVVADGSEWIWQEVGKYFAKSVQILDFYHACQHLWSVAHAQFGESDEASKTWMQEQQERLLSNQVAEVIAAVESWEPTEQEGREVRGREVGYLGSHAHRMLYGSLRQGGWHIGSGVMEAACKAVVQGRMKGVGMRWSQKGAEAMLHLRSAWCSSAHTDFADVARRSIRPS